MTVRLPYTTFDIESDIQKVRNQDQRILFIGQKVASGTATPLTIIEDIPNDTSWDTLLGATSMLAGMIRAAKQENVVSRMDAIAVEDNIGSTASTADITIVGATSADTELTIDIGSSINYSYTISVENGDNETAIAAAWETLINADSKRIVEASAVAGVLTLTAKNSGLEGNSIGLRVTGDLAGLTSITVPHMAGGTVSPVIDTIPTVIGNRRYQHIVMPQSYDVSAIATWLDGRFSVDNDIRNGTLLISKTDSVTNLKTLGNGYDNKSLDIHGNITAADYEGSSIFELDTVIASKCAAIWALRLTDDANISRLTLSAYGARDAFGGMHLASKPYHNTPFFNLPVADAGDEISNTEQKELNTAGVFFLGNNPVRREIISGDVVTTYKTHPVTSQSDISFKYQNYVDTLSEIREYFVNNVRARFAQARLTEGDIVDDIDMANENSISAYLNELYEDLTDEALTVKGNNALRFFKANKTVSLDVSTGKVVVNMKVPIVTQIREIEGVIEVSFTITLQAAA